MSAIRIRRGATTAAALLLAALSASACKWGTRPDRFEPAMGPEGVRVAVRVHGEARDRLGELFAVDTAGVTLRGERLVLVAWPKLAAMDLRGLGSGYDIRFGEVPAADKRERLALVSRFPQGLRGELLARVLAALQQPALEEVR